MTPERLRQIEALYHSARERDPASQIVFLADACGTDNDLRREIESLLAQETSGNPLADPPWEGGIPGAQLGPYKLEASIGAGGMGEVYKAHDTRLGRDVAIKVAAEKFSDRFEREARAIAALNHPNICALYDVGPDYLVMELIDGETLAEVIARGPLPIETAFDYARQIANALEAAHEKGIIHRDLKPGNIKVTPQGVVKVLDFGIAKRAERPGADPENSPTMTTPTRAGMIMGTAAYMSPEQARGKMVDKRADIWAFGVVLYEMVTGKSLFKGEDVSDTLAAVIKHEPDLSPAPAQLRPLLQSCLEKNPSQRLRDIGDWSKLLNDPPSTPSSSPTRQGGAISRGDKWLWPSVAALLAVALAALAFLEWRRSQQPDRSPVTRLTMELAPAEALIPDFAGRPSRTALAIAPDGNTVVFSALNPGASINLRTVFPPSSLFKLYRRTLDQTESVPIPGTEGAIGPFFSPDGQWIGFWADGKLKKVALSGGPAFTVCEAQTPLTVGLWGASWSSTDTIAFVLPAGELMQVAAKGGTPGILLPRDPAKGEAYYTPEFLPDGKTLLYTLRTSENWADAQIVVRLENGERRVLIQGGTDARYVPSGHLLYMQNAVLMAVPFDARRIQLAGSPVAMLGGVMQTANAINGNYETGMGQFAASASGNLIYAAGGIYPPRISTLLRVDRNGGEAEVNAPKGDYGGPRVSPDGRKLAVHKRLETSRLTDIWVLDLVTGYGTRLTSQGTNVWPLWSPDGKRLLFSGGPGLTQIVSIAADGSGSPQTVFTAKSSVKPASWSVDGRLAYLEGRQIFTRSMSANTEPEPFSDSKSIFEHAQFSPDGRWMAYTSTETGRPEVWVRAVAGPGEKYPLSSGITTNPVWARDQRELFYLVSKPLGKLGMMVVDVAPGAAFKHSQPRQLFEGDYYISTPLRGYDITPDGQHFIMLRADPPPLQLVTRLNVVLNWFDELRRRAPQGK